jgi:hypothetical protein
MSSRYQAGIVLPGYNALLVPDAPTIGTATAGGGSASVAFTAPSNVGGGAITSYKAISTPGGFTGTGASSPVTVSGLTSGTAYTFKVFATNAYGPSSLSAASNSITPLPVVGAAYGGGFFAGQISTAGNGIADYNLVIGPKASAQANKQWKNANSPNVTGAASVINGPQNTADIVADGSSTVYPAAHFCNDLVTGGQTDWYMPAKNELEVCYYNLKPGDTPNNTGFGTNTNAVPSRPSNYTAGTPAQTSATNFRTGAGSEEFDTVKYWASTKGNSVSNPFVAWNQTFDNGYQDGNFGRFTYSYATRAIRRVAV